MESRWNIAPITLVQPVTTKTTNAIVLFIADFLSQLSTKTLLERLDTVGSLCRCATIWRWDYH